MMTDNARGAALMTLAMVAFTVNDACIKSLSGVLPLSQAVFLRGLAVSLLLAGWVASHGGLRPAAVPRGDWALILLRSLAEFLSALLFLTALYHMPIANASAILQALPLTVTLGAMLVFGEAVGPRRLTAIGVGFVGVLLIVRPGAEGFNVYSLWAVAAVLAVTVRDLAARRMSRATPSPLVALAASVVVTLCMGAGFAVQDWRPVPAPAAWALAGASAAVLVGYVSSVMAMRVGEIGAVAPFRYTSLLASLAVGVVLFDELPGAVTLAGAALVVGMGLYTLMRDRQLARAAARAGAGGLRPR